MIYKNLVNSFVRSWNFTRSETLEILDSLDDEKLNYKPSGDKFQQLFWEFGDIGRTQLVYSKGIETGVMDFSYFSSNDLPKKDQFKTKIEIKKFLEESNIEWIESIRLRRREDDFVVKWPGFKRPLTNHIAKLMEHERLHHGQFITYFTLAEFDLPPNFKKNWSL